jgi:hypothetical protein
MTGLQARKANIFEREARHGMRSLERITATPSCPIKPIAERPLALRYSVNIDHADRSAIKAHGKTVSLAG